jgi:NADH:ubiquinone oxidoreductase subunit H
MQVWNFSTSKLSLLTSTSYNAVANGYSSAVSDTFILETINVYSISIYALLASSFAFMIILLEVIYVLLSDSMSSSMLDSLVVSIKFLLLVALLVFIRGGIPRYRFDHLTKMGWIKFLSLVLASILVEMLLIWIF